LSKPGTGSALSTSTASTLPSAERSGIGSSSNGLTRSSTRRRASEGLIGFSGTAKLSLL
jgi:hypothetical protein